jgi:sugar/nucleoside kinase (ribokinase family)
MIGQHEFRDYMLSKLYEHKIEVTDIIDEINSDTHFSVIISSIKNGERTVFASPVMKEQRKRDIIPIQDFDVCLVDGFLAETAGEITSIAKNSGIITVMDGGSWKTGMEQYLENIEYAVCSSDFFPPGCKTQKEIIGFLHDYGITNIAITRGEKSILAFENGRKKEIAVNKIDAVDTLGAGDVFHGAFCYFLLRDNNFVNALKLASDVAAESCKYYGTREWSFKINKQE